MSLNSDETPTGPIPGMRGPTNTKATTRPPGGYPRSGSPSSPPFAAAPAGNAPRRLNVIRDLLAGLLLILALLFPWTTHFGFLFLGNPDAGFLIPGSPLWVWIALGVVTLLSLVAPVTNVLLGAALPGRARLGLAIPYVLLVLAFVGFDVVETIRFGGTVQIPGGIGPGAWLGLAGALLSAQPLLSGPPTEASHHRWLTAARMIGYASMFGASLSSGFNLCWQVRYALQAPDGSLAFGTNNIMTAVTVLVYVVVALATLLVASRWVLKNAPDSRFTILALGASTLIAGMLIWVVPGGRAFDAFHSVAQNTSIAGVGYEGYLAWAAAAALFVPLTLFGSPTVRADKTVWRGAIRKGLLLIAVWCVGSTLMRITDLIGGAVLKLPYSSYDSLTLATFNLITAGLALWLYWTLGNGALRGRLVRSLGGLVFTMMVARVTVGVLLAPRFQQAGSPGPVYGNDQAHQITSTFDVVLSALAFFIFAAIAIAPRVRNPKRRRQRLVRRPAPASGPRPSAPDPTRPGAPPVPPGPPGPTGPTGPSAPSEAWTRQFTIPRKEPDAATSVLSAPGGAPRIFRPGPPGPPPGQPGPPRPAIFRPPPGRPPS